MVGHTPSRRHHGGLTTAVVLIGVLGGCGGGEETCFRTSDCKRGFQCTATTPGESGLCRACDSTETHYDGLDNDCDPSSLDSDLDGDGDNYAGATVNPGGDCDDMNPSVNSRAVELCDDQIDNDCDGPVDEEDCGDFNPPIIRIVSPRNGEEIRGTVNLDVSAMDDTWITSLAVSARNESLLVFTVQDRTQTSFLLPIDTLGLPDGLQSILVRATDGSGKTAEASVQVRVDNDTGPDIRLLRPLADLDYGGFFDIEVSASRPEDVLQIEFFLDQDLVHTATAAPYIVRIDSRSRPDGPLSIEAVGTDPFGQRSVVSVMVRVDNTGPVVSMDPSPGGILSGAVTLVVQADDPAGIQSVEALGRTSASSPLTISTNSNVLINGAFDIEVTAVDDALVDGAAYGNVTVQSFSYVVVGGIDASIDWVEPALGADIYQGPNVFEVTASGVSALDWYANGVHLGRTQRSAGSHKLRVNLEFVESNPVVLQVRGSVGPGGSVPFVAENQVTLVPASAYRATKVALVPGATLQNFHLLTGCGAQLPEKVHLGMGDFDGDGHLDVFGCATGEGRLVFGVGKAWPGAVVRAAGNSVHAATMADVNGDGLADLIQGAAGSRRISIYHGNQMRSLTTNGDQSLSFSENTIAERFFPADFDGDGDTDILRAYTVSGGLTRYMFLEASNGMLQPRSAVDRLTSNWVDVADVDNDGRLDLVSLAEAATTPGTVAFYRNLGNLTLGDAVTLATPPGTVDFAFGDMTGDGYPDLVLGVQDRLMLAAGSSGNFGTYDPPVDLANPGGLVHGVHLAELDGTPGLEVIVSYEWTADRPRGALAIFGRQGANLELRQIYTASYGRGITDVDWNGDGARDLIVFGAEGAALSRAELLLGYGGGEFASVSMLQLPPGVLTDRAILGDFVPGGSIKDVAVGDLGVVRILRSDSGPRLTQVLEMNLHLEGYLDRAVQVEALVGRDLDSQNGPEIIACGGSACQRFTSQPGGTYTYVHLAPESVGAQALTFADVNDDGADELLMSTPGGLQVRPENGGAPIYTGTMPGPSFRFVVGRFGADPFPWVVDGDYLHAWTGANFVQSALPSMQGSLAAGDVNGDGFDDLVAADASAIVTMLRGGPMGLEIAPRAVSTSQFGMLGTARLLHDINGDGLADLLAGGLIYIARPSGDFFPFAVPWPGGEVCRELSIRSFYDAGAEELLCAGGSHLRIHRPAP